MPERSKLMTYNEFLETMKTEVQNRLGEAYRVDLQDVIKTNDMVYNGLTIADKNINIAPTIYLNDMYEKYAVVDEKEYAADGHPRMRNTELKRMVQSRRFLEFSIITNAMKIWTFHFLLIGTL